MLKVIVREGRFRKWKGYVEKIVKRECVIRCRLCKVYVTDKVKVWDGGVP